MFFAYVLRSLKNGRFYYGSTNDMERRLREHNGGHTRSLRHVRPLEVLYKEEFSTNKEARARERFFKSGKGREFLKGLKFKG